MVFQEFWELILTSPIVQEYGVEGRSPNVGLFLGADAAVALSCFGVAIALFSIVRRRESLPLRLELWLATILLVCGISQLFDIWRVWLSPLWLQDSKMVWVLGGGQWAATVVLLYAALKVVLGVSKRASTLAAAADQNSGLPLTQATEAHRPDAQVTETQNTDTQNTESQNTDTQNTESQRTAAHNLDKSQAIESAMLASETRFRNIFGQSLERLELSLQTAQMGFWDWDLVEQTQVWSLEMEFLLGYQQGEVRHSYDNWARRIHPKDLKLAVADIQTTIQTHQPFITQYRVVLPDGTERWIHAQGYVVLSPEQQPLRLVGTIQDVTQTVHTERSLKLSEARFRTIFEQAAVGMARFALDGRWIQVNQKLCDILGYTADEMLRRTFRDITDSEDIETDRHYYQQMVAGKLKSCSYEKRYRHKNGDSIWTTVTISKEFKPTGGLLCFIAVIEDIGDRKQAQEQLQRKARELSTLNLLLAQMATLLEKRNAELNQFSYVASHDLKAPLRAIANLSQWIEEDVGDRLPPENQYQLQLMRGRVNRMEALINGLLEYSRIGYRQHMIEQVDIGELIANTVDSLDPPAAFEVAIAPNMPTLNTKVVALQQIFSNLVSNAIKHHNRQAGKVAIAVQPIYHGYEFAVSDDGPGIEPQYYDKVFKIFQTLKARDETENTGIGLSVVKKIVETEGGAVWIESEPGQGTTFRFTWPE
ncbi:MAG: PAS domain S-box protein [Elainellaceae cyanobacterium]